MIGKNATRHLDILHAERGVLRSIVDGTPEYFPLTENSLLSYTPISAFEVQPCTDCLLSCLIENNHNDRPWNPVKAAVDEVPSQVCGHSSLTDMRLLLEGNNLWSEPAADYGHVLLF